MGSWQANTGASLQVIGKGLEAASKTIADLRLERLAYLLDHPSGWDVTEGEGDEAKPFPATKENILSLPGERLPALMLERCESVVDSFLAPNAGGNSLLT